MLECQKLTHERGEQQYEGAARMIKRANAPDSAVTWDDLATTRSDFAGVENDKAILQALRKAYSEWISCTGHLDRSGITSNVRLWLEIPNVW